MSKKYQIICADPLGVIGMSVGIDYLNAFLLKLMEWVWDMGHGDERPCPVNDEKDVKRQIKW